MSHPSTNQPLPLAPATDLQADDLDEVLALPLAAPQASTQGEASRQRLMAKVARSLAAEAGMVTVRHRQVPRLAVAPGVQAQALYAAAACQALRPGEPLRCQVLHLDPGSTLDSRCLPLPAAAQPGTADSAAGTVVREWLVLHGAVQLQLAPVAPGTPRPDVPTEASSDRHDHRQGHSQVDRHNERSAPAAEAELGLRDYHRGLAGAPGLLAPVWHSAGGARLFLRESTAPASAAADSPCTVRDQDAGWPEFAPGIQRRVLWHGQGQAAMLYLAAPGACVPNHAHGHDEECLMVQGELYLDDVLLQAGDYQIAPAGTGHRLTQTDTGVVIYAHGDQDLQFC